MRNILSFGLAVLLFGSMLWGQCASCPMFQSAATESHDCCHEKQPVKHPVHDQCPNDAVAPATYAQAGLDVAQLMPLMALAAEAPVPILTAPALPVVLAAANSTVDPQSPPDLCLLNSVLLV